MDSLLPYTYMTYSISQINRFVIINLQRIPPSFFQDITDFNTTSTQPSRSRQLHSLALKSPSFQFILRFYSTLLPEACPDITPEQGSHPACLQLTGIIGIPPPPGSLAAALIAWSPAKGAVTGRKYHYELSGVMAIQFAMD